MVRVRLKPNGKLERRVVPAAAMHYIVRRIQRMAKKGSDRTVLALLEMIGDRFDGKPVAQMLGQVLRETRIIIEDGGPAMKADEADGGDDRGAGARTVADVVAPSPPPLDAKAREAAEFERVK